MGAALRRCNCTCQKHLLQATSTSPICFPGLGTQGVMTWHWLPVHIARAKSVLHIHNIHEALAILTCLVSRDGSQILGQPCRNAFQAFYADKSCRYRLHNSTQINPDMVAISVENGRAYEEASKTDLNRSLGGPAECPQGVRCVLRPQNCDSKRRNSSRGPREPYLDIIKHFPDSEPGHPTERDFRSLDTDSRCAPFR